MKPSQNQSPLASTSAERPSAGVLCADARTGLVLRRALEDRGWDVTWMKDAHAVLRRSDTRRHQVLLAILDGVEPEVLGTLAAVARRPKPPPVVLLTRMATARTLGPAVLRALGVSRLLSWPARIDPIAAALEETRDAFRGPIATAPHRSRRETSP